MAQVSSSWLNTGVKSVCASVLLWFGVAAHRNCSDVLCRVTSAGDEGNELKSGILRLKAELFTSLGCAVELKVKPDFPHLNNTSWWSKIKLLNCQYLVMDSHTVWVFSFNIHIEVIEARNIFIISDCRVSNGLQSCYIFISGKESGKEMGVFCSFLADFGR